MKKIKNVVIFAAGKGTRMAPLTQYLPKPLVQVHGEPIIERNIKFLQQVGIKNISIVVGYFKEQFTYLVEKYDVRLIENPDFDIANNISSLWYARDSFNDTLYVEGDLYFNENIFSKLVPQINNTNCSIAFSIKGHEHKPEWMYKIDANQNIISHHLVKDSFMKNIWSGLLFIDATTAEQMRQNLAEYYKNYPNNYFESFLWTLNTKFKHFEINNIEIRELDTFEDLQNLDSRYRNHATTLLFTPGPINNYNEVNDILSQCVLHHRSQLFKYYLEDTTKLIRELFKTQSALPLFITSSATGAMEAIVVNLAQKGENVLLIEAGDFGKRFKILLQRLGLNETLTTISFADGKTFDFDQIQTTLKNNKFKSIFVTHHETSTGVLHDIEKLSKIVKKYASESLFIVDTVSSFIHDDVKFDEWGLDAVIATSGKAFCLMPGLSCIVLSQRAIESAKQNTNFKFYFDIPAYVKYYYEQKSTPYTPASAILVAMNAAIRVIKNQTIDAIRKEKKLIYNYIRDELIKLGFSDVVKGENITHGLLVMNTPKNYNAEILRNTIEYKSNIYFEVGRNGRQQTQVRIGIPNVIDMPKAKLLIDAIKENIHFAKIT
ncbi:aminotransferase class V-fold PLP-dependent enzyme [Mycoplasmopsis phocirhinis]|uniref:Aminotransferase class V-fold PLP-dependent enzyme n=1 Tax=Mycoplasmopsis phocirhinis TaxID=142650 RepID=A0A4V0ZAH3_9BACT|nr:aminotransferase class V-fold PLP-dependent enzyme [Mycoplasmopsis phocirhinis]QBF34702.1 aminotransferase class V-fold PLP-dependent enzyme [Mycoplasmopsis phocirhinis]